MLNNKQKPYLVLDASSKQVQGGIFLNQKWIYSFNISKPALEVFNEHLSIITQHTPLETLAGFIYNEGPGSTLGIRTVLTYIRTWIQFPKFKNHYIYSYQSLPFMAYSWAIKRPELTTFSLISPARKGYYHTVIYNKLELSSIQEITETDLKNIKQPIFLLPQAKLWNTLENQDYPQITYHLDLLPIIFENYPSLFHQPTDYLPFEYTPHENHYALWTPKRHHAAL